MPQIENGVAVKAVAVCAYSEFTKLDGGDPNNGFQVIALDQLVRNDPAISVIIFPTGVGIPTLGQQLAAKFDQIHNGSKNIRVIVAPPDIAATTTIEETDTTRDLLPDYINHVIFLGVEDHTPRIARNAQDAFKNRLNITVEVASCDQILIDGHRELVAEDFANVDVDPNDNFPNHILFALSNWRQSDLDQARALREGHISQIDRLPGSRILFNFVNAVTGGSRGLNQTLLGKKINQRLRARNL